MNKFIKDHISWFISLIILVMVIFLFVGKNYVDAKDIKLQRDINIDIKSDVNKKFNVIIKKLDQLDSIQHKF